MTTMQAIIDTLYSLVDDEDAYWASVDHLLRYFDSEHERDQHLDDLGLPC